MKIIHKPDTVTVELKSLKVGDVFYYPASLNYGEDEYGMVMKFAYHIEFTLPTGTIPVVTLDTGEIRFWTEDARVIPIDTELKVL